MKNKVFIIAEAGINHNGNLEIAKELIYSASEAGVDAVKFQTFSAEKLVSKHALKADYQKKTTDPEESQFDMIKKLELELDAYNDLIDDCKKRKILFLSSPFDLESIDLLNKLGMNIIKIPSGEITNLPYLRKIGGLQKKVILSTGMSDINEIKAAMSILLKAGAIKDNITLLHCNTEYPTPMEHVNLSAMLSMKKAFKIDIGYSDHTTGIEIPIAAAALGAAVIEKHFTLDKNMEGPDHKASLEPHELKMMVNAIRNIEKAMGNGIKRPSPSEIKNKSIARKSIVAAMSIQKGEIFSESNIAIKRPGDGLNPMQWDNIIGRKAKRKFQVDELIEI